MLLASVMDSGDTLSVSLSADEHLRIASGGTSYSLTANGQNFTDGGVTNVSAFAGFGTAALTLNDLTQYSTIRIGTFPPLPGTRAAMPVLPKIPASAPPPGSPAPAPAQRLSQQAPEGNFRNDKIVLADDAT